jgi:LysM repeat protein
MNDFRQISFGILAALLSASLVLGSFSLALTEGAQRVALLPTAVQSDTQEPVVVPGPLTPAPTTRTSDLAVTETGTSTTLPEMTASPTPTASATQQCPAPAGWVTIIVQPGDTLESLARKYNITESALMQANCMVLTGLIPGTELYVPGPASSPTSRPVQQCGPPAGWVSYTIQPGDNLYRLSRELGVTISQLQFANCLGSSTLIRAGDKLYVPFIPARPTSPPPTLTDTPIPPTQTPTPITPTPVPTPQPTAAPTTAPTAEPTQEPTAEPTQEPTAEPTTEPTTEPTAEPTQEPTEEPTAEPTEEPTTEPTTL